jgi:mannose-6-phosphate isomerase-like protein (cupin superfamily)
MGTAVEDILRLSEFLRLGYRRRMKRFHMGLGLTVLFVAGLGLGAAGGAPIFPNRIVHVPAEKREQAIYRGAVAGKGTNELVPRDMDLGVRVSMGRKVATPPVTPPEAHTTFGHVYLIEDGGGTLILGGELIEPRENRPGEWTGTSIKGGQRFEMKKGDMITVQVGMPHQWVDVPKNVSYLAFHSFPEHNQPK